MSSLLESTSNTRAVLPGRLRMLRSDAPVAPTERDVQWLLGHGVRTLIDLRSDRELARRPCPLAVDARFDYRHMPVTGGNAMPASPEDVPRSYIAMADAQMIRILAAIEGAQGGVMFFCAAGKDRTGVTAALLQRRAGLDRRAIVDDYVLSGMNLAGELSAFGQQHPEIDPRIYHPQRIYMEAFLDWAEGQTI